MPEEQHPLELILARNLIAALSVPAFLVGLAGDVVFYNEAAGALLGSRFEETGTLTRETWRHIGPLDAEGEPIERRGQPLWTALRERRPAHGRFHIRTDSARVVEIETSALPLIAGHEHRGALVVFWPVEARQ
jgi:PAS domain-containing protein